jgi:hypothetical protein
MTDIDSRSQARRSAAELPATVGFNQPLRVLDISATGVRVETSEWLAPGRRYSLRLGRPPLQVSGLVTRSMLVRVEQRDSGCHPIFEAGLSFDGAATPTSEQLAQLMARLAAGELDDELPTRQIARR